MIRSQQVRGFTIFEVIVVMSLIALIIASVGPLFASNSDMVEDSRAHQRAEAAHQRNLAALTRLLRSIDIQTLDGFSSEGIATTPSFSRVTGADLDDLTYTGSEQLRWVASPIGVDGVPSPGAVYLERDGRRFLIADRVPAGGFVLRQEGQNLVIQLSTYWATSTSRVVTRSTESVVSIRN
jgi:prepilin-type N-terminal cleavage/methylation domain-containing protein